MPNFSVMTLKFGFKLNNASCRMGFRNQRNMKQNPIEDPTDSATAPRT